MVDAQHTVNQCTALYCLTRSGSEYCIASGDGLGEWNNQAVSFTFTPDIASFRATTDALYILSDDGTLYSSTNGSEWTSTSAKYDFLYGGYGTTLIGSLKTDEGWKIQSYPDMTLTTLPEGMPVGGTSNPVEYSFSMSSNPQIIIVGGRKADNTLSNAAWGFDGNNWAKISKHNLPVALEDVAVAPYYTFTTSSSWNAERYATLIALGGRKADGSVSSKVYISNNYGYTWAEASSLMQLPSYVPAMYDSQAFVVTKTLDSGSRASKPIESWECPYIYLFGGIGSNGQLHNTVWCGVINRLSFKPIQ